jgi:hypothetical protein
MDCGEGKNSNRIDHPEGRKGRFGQHKINGSAQGQKPLGILA